MKTISLIIISTIFLIGCNSQKSDIDPTAIATGVQEPLGISDGIWLVGPEVKPGRYVTTVADDSAGCYWARLRDFEGTYDSIVDDGLWLKGAKARITIKETDVAIELVGGCIWVREVT